MADNSAKKKILLVDDNVIQLEITGLLLESEYEIITAKSGKEALGYLLKGIAPSLILLDIVMPHMDGWETFNRLKAISCLQDVPIAFLTSLKESNEMDRAYAMGAADFIMKPVEKDDLLARVRNILEKRESKSAGL